MWIVPWRPTACGIPTVVDFSHKHPSYCNVVNRGLFGVWTSCRLLFWLPTIGAMTNSFASLFIPLVVVMVSIQALIILVYVCIYWDQVDPRACEGLLFRMTKFKMTWRFNPSLQLTSFYIWCTLSFSCQWILTISSTHHCYLVVFWSCPFTFYLWNYSSFSSNVWYSPKTVNM